MILHVKQDHIKEQKTLSIDAFSKAPKAFGGRAPRTNLNRLTYNHPEGTLPSDPGTHLIVVAYSPNRLYRVHMPNNISISSAVLAQHMLVTNTHTDNHGKRRSTSPISNIIISKISSHQLVKTTFLGYN